MKSTSPTTRVEIQLDFDGAVKELLADKKLRRLDWPKECYVKLEGLLKIYIDGKKQEDWYVSRADLEAEDYIVV